MYLLKQGVIAQAIETLIVKVRDGYKTPFGVKIENGNIHVDAIGKNGELVQQSYPVPANETKWIIWDGVSFVCVDHKELHYEYLFKEDGLLF